MGTPQTEIDKLDAMRGATGPHVELAARVESIGLEVVVDPSNSGRSVITLRGAWSGSGGNVAVGEILGDSQKARIV